MLKFHVIFYLCICTIYIFCNTEDNYGNFKLTIQEVELCKGPKRKDCAVITQRIVNSVGFMYKMNVTQSMSPTKGKIVAISNGKQLLRLQLDNPCRHLFLRPLFQMMLNVSQDCIVRKGYYSFIVDVNEIAQSYYGGAFVYGNFTFKSHFYSSECNLSCTTVKVVIAPSDNKKSN